MTRRLALLLAMAFALVGFAAGGHAHGAWWLLDNLAALIVGGSLGFYAGGLGRPRHPPRPQLVKLPVEQPESPVSRANGEPGVVPTSFGPVPVQRRLGHRLECCCGVIFSELSWESDWLLHVSTNPGHRVKELLSTQLSTFPCG